MPFNNLYLRIDLEKTGRRLGELIRENGYSVKDIQDILHLSCPQPVYRWMRGQVLPTVDHLYVLAQVFQVHMEELLVTASGIPENLLEKRSFLRKRICEYGRKYRCREAA